MNFDNMPELRWQYGYFILLGAIAAVCLGLCMRRSVNDGSAAVLAAQVERRRNRPASAAGAQTIYGAPQPYYRTTHNQKPPRRRDT